MASYSTYSYGYAGKTMLSKVIWLIGKVAVVAAEKGVFRKEYKLIWLVVIVYINVDDMEEQLGLKEAMGWDRRQHWEQAHWNLALCQQHSEEKLGAVK